MFNRAQGVNGKSEWLPRRTGEHLILCDIHREMSAFLLVLDHPFFSIVDHQALGEFKIENIPAGMYTLVVVRDVRGKLKEYKQEVLLTGGEVHAVTIQF